MNVMAQVQGLIRVVKKPKAEDQEAVLTAQKEAMYTQIVNQAARIVRLQEKAHGHLRLVNEHHDETQDTVVGMELNVAEQVFFTLYNKLRSLYNLSPLKSKEGKFTGEYNYAAHL